MTGPRRVVARALALLVVAATLGAQGAGGDSLIVRAFDLEDARPAEAFALYRRAFGGETLVPALLGLERLHHARGTVDSLVAVSAEAARLRPRDGVVRGVQFRTLALLRRDDDLRAAFRDWVRAAPGEPGPFKEYARALLDLGQAAAADSVLDVATRAMRDPRDFTAELAQVAVAAGRWGEAGRRWRTALAVEPALAGAAVATLGVAPEIARDTIREAMGGMPPVTAARRALAELELAWGAPRRGWAVLAELAPSEETAAAWRAFAEAAEERQAPLVARDAWAALARWRRDPEVALRAATAALDGGDAAGALPFTTVAQSLLAPSLVLRDVLPVRLRALAALGRAADAAALVDSVRPALAPLQLRVLESQLGWAFLRAGDVARARPLVPRMDDDEAAALLAVYEGDFARARTLLAGADAANTLLLVPRTLLARSRAATAPQAGRGLAALARADTAAAVAAFEAAAVETPDAAPLLRALAARARGATPGALDAWRRLATEHPTAPEAIEADLAWARLALAAGDTATAIARLEHLILTWPTSALVPQARRALDDARRRAGGPS